MLSTKNPDSLLALRVFFEKWYFFELMGGFEEFDHRLGVVF
jgi:hypothetical protein